MTYVGAPRPHGCLFCDAGGGAERDRLVLGWSAHALVMLNRYPYQSGHVLIAPRRHGADLGSLPDAEYDDLQRTRHVLDTYDHLRPAFAWLDAPAGAVVPPSASGL